MHLVTKHTYDGHAVPDRLGEAKYYESMSVIGTDSTEITLRNAYGMTIFPIGTLGVSYRVTQNPDYAGVAQVMSNTLTGDILQGGILSGSVYARDLNSGTVVIVNGTIAGARQVETLTVVGTVGTTGTIAMYLTSALFGTGKAWTVPVTAGNTPVAIAGNIYTATTGSVLDDAGTTLLYTLASPGTTAALIMTAYRAAANDATWQWGYEDQNGLTTGTSANTTAGAAVSTMAASALIMGTALFSNANVGSFFTVAVTGTTVTMTARAAAGSDSTMDFAWVNTSTIGFNESASTLVTNGTEPGDGQWFTIATGASLTIAPPAGCITEYDWRFAKIYAKATHNILLGCNYWGFPSIGSGACVGLT